MYYFGRGHVLLFSAVRPHLAGDYLPGYFLKKPLHGDGQLAKEALDDGATFGKLVLDFNVQDVCQQRYKCIFLERETHIDPG